MDYKNNLIKDKIYTPFLYQNLLSIIIIHKNGDILPTLKKLNIQLYQPVEIIIIDNSNNEMFNIIDNYITNNNYTNMQLFHSKTNNIYECLNIGLSKSKGNYIMFHITSNHFSPLRYTYQIDELTKYNNNKQSLLSLCLSNQPDSNNLILSPLTICISRYVFQKLGFFKHELKESCFEEYLWRYLIVIEGIYHENKSFDFLKNDIKNNDIHSLKIVNKCLYTDSNVGNEILYRNEYEESHKNINIKDPKTYFYPYHNEIIFSKTSYLTQVFNVLKGYNQETRITFVYFTDHLDNIQSYFDEFYDIFQCPYITTIIGYYGENLPETNNIFNYSMDKELKNITILKSKTYAESVSTIINDIKTVYTFILPSMYKFNSVTMLHPLSYLLDFMDKYSSEINSLRFNHHYNKTDDIDKVLKPIESALFPEILNTSGNYNDPQIINTIHFKKFKSPFIKTNMKEDGVFDSLLKKYNNIEIALKLKSCIYGGLNYPNTCIKN